MKRSLLSALLSLSFLLCLSTPLGAEEPLRVGHFPNITHAQAVVAHELSRQGKGWFEEAVKNKIEWYVYNAGPAAMEALLSGAIDIAYVGPSPALNAFVKSRGRYLRVIAGAARGGSALIVHKGSGLESPLSFKGKKVATPQFGNTQDVSARAWFINAGLSITQTGGEVTLIPTANPDQLTLFKRGELDAVWTVEPWVSRLELEANGQVLVREDNTLTTVLAVSTRALTERRKDIDNFLRAHYALTDWINANRSEAQRLLRLGIKADTTQSMSDELIERSWPRLRFEKTVSASEFSDFLAKAKQVGFLKDAGDVSQIVEIPVE